MKNREEIKNYIKKHKAVYVELMYDLLVNILLGNNDFRLVKNAEYDDLRPIIEKESGECIEFSLDTIIGSESLEIIRKIKIIKESNKKLEKAERVDLIADILEDDTLFEGFCLAFYNTDEELQSICGNFGCEELYLKLSKDKIYQKRKSYIHMIVNYVIAATNLYGVIHIGDLETLVLHYEKRLDHQGYARTEGNYQNTVMFNPRFLSTCVLHQLIGDIVPTICTTMDGFIMHECFRADYQKEHEAMLQFFSNKKGEVTGIDLQRFYDSVADSSFRVLYQEVCSKQRYLPNKKEFLLYVNEDYYKISNAEKEARSYIERKYGRMFAPIAAEAGVNIAEWITNFMNEVHDIVTDMGKVDKEIDPQESIAIIVELMQHYGAEFADIDEANTAIKYINKVINSVRLWSNHGHTTDEIMRQILRGSRLKNVVPGSTHAAKVLEEGREELEKMEIHLDLDATATNIPTIGFGQGINETITRTTKKVYPNDLCPCHSGKNSKGVVEINKKCEY